MLIMLPSLCCSSELVNTEDLTLGFVRINELNAMTAVEINNGQEYLLCFHCESSVTTPTISCLLYCLQLLEFL